MRKLETYVNEKLKVTKSSSVPDLISFLESKDKEEFDSKCKQLLEYLKNDSNLPMAVSSDITEKYKSSYLQDGDVVIADTAEDETTGKACEIGNSQGLDVVSGLHTMVCRPRNKLALGYLGYYLNSDAYHHQLLPLMQGIKVLSLSRTNVQKTMVCYPKSKAEQQLIADCFRNLDTLITLHQRESTYFTGGFYAEQHK